MNTNWISPLFHIPPSPYNCYPAPEIWPEVEGWGVGAWWVTWFPPGTNQSLTEGGKEDERIKWMARLPDGHQSADGTRLDFLLKTLKRLGQLISHASLLAKARRWENPSPTCWSERGLFWPLVPAWGRQTPDTSCFHTQFVFLPSSLLSALKRRRRTAEAVGRGSRQARYFGRVD